MGWGWDRPTHPHIVEILLPAPNSSLQSVLVNFDVVEELGVVAFKVYPTATSLITPKRIREIEQDELLFPSK